MTGDPGPLLAHEEGYDLLQAVFNAYPYLVAGLIGLLFVALGLAIAPSLHRRWMLLSGLLLIPFSLSAPIFDGPYWIPKRLGGGAWGIEGVLFCFTSGSIAWLSGALPLASRLSPPARVDWQQFFQRSVRFVMVGILLFYCARWSGFGVMASALVAQSATALAILLLHPPVWPMQAIAAALHTAVYAIIVSLAAWTTDTYVAMWNGSEIWGVYFAEMPLEEWLWMISFNLAYPAMLAYSAGFRIVRAGHRDQVPETGAE